MKKKEFIRLDTNHITEEVKEEFRLIRIFIREDG